MPEPGLGVQEVPKWNPAWVFQYHPPTQGLCHLTTGAFMATFISGALWEVGKDSSQHSAPCGEAEPEAWHGRAPLSALVAP